MATTEPRRRITPDMTPAQKKRAVRALLRELAAVLAAARRENRALPWPASPATPPADESPTAAV